MEKILSEHLKCSVVIIEQRMLDSGTTYIHFKIPSSICSFIINSTTLSPFSLRGITNYDKINNKFEQCKKISRIEELLEYNFDSQLQYGNIVINSQYQISVSPLQIHIYDTKSKSYIFEHDINSVSIYDILDHPVLQPFRINHSKLINQTMFE